MCGCILLSVAMVMGSQVMKERYNATGNDRMTDEFMKPMIVDNNGLVQSEPCYCCAINRTIDDLKSPCRGLNQIINKKW